jgi:hypothetical protein
VGVSLKICDVTCGSTPDLSNVQRSGTYT